MKWIEAQLHAHSRMRTRTRVHFISVGFSTLPSGQGWLLCSAEVTGEIDKPPSRSVSVQLSSEVMPTY